MQLDGYNRELLLRRLQEEDAFDVELDLQDRDRLQLTFQFSESGTSGAPTTKVITYGYSWKAGRWDEEEFCPLAWQWHHDWAMSGEVQVEGPGT